MNTEDINTQPVTEAAPKQPSVPNNIYLKFENEETITQSISENLNMFQINKLLSLVKSTCNPMHEALKKKSKVFIFGAGGTTSWFLPKLLKIYNDAFHKVPNLRYELQIVLIDQDIVETKNLIRQNFISEDVGRNKAEVLSERYSDLYQNITVSFVPKYATYTTFDKNYLKGNTYSEDHFVCLSQLNISKNDILINLVDNEGFKKKLDFYINRHKNPLFAAGVNLFNGQVYYTTNQNTNGYVHDHPDLLEIFDEVSVHACADHDANGTDDNPEQLFNGNDVAASLLANIYQTVLTSVPLYKRINFISGDNMNVSTGSRNYSVLYYYVKNYLKDNFKAIEESKEYFLTYGNKGTRSAKRHEKFLKENQLLEIFKSLYEGMPVTELFEVPPLTPIERPVVPTETATVEAVPSPVTE